MFDLEEIREIMKNQKFEEDVRYVKRSLKSHFDTGPYESDEMASRLGYFVESVLASCEDWPNHGADVCELAAEISEYLARFYSVESASRRRFKLKAALLYEFANKPVMAQGTVDTADFDEVVVDFFQRTGPFADFQNARDIGNIQPLPTWSLEDMTFVSDALKFNEGATGPKEIPQHFASFDMAAVAKNVNVGSTSTDFRAFSRVIQKRLSSVTRSYVDERLFARLRETRFPLELWPSQVEAVEGGLLDDSIKSWGLAAPTGTGKTSLMRMLILKAILEKPGSNVIYIVPSRALVYEVSTSISSFLADIEIDVVDVSPQLVGLSESERSRMHHDSVVVLTPEKADLLLRLGDKFFRSTSAVIVDEAHHIESGTRGLLLEMYLWRLKKIAKATRFVLLSAVAPNIGELAAWMDDVSKSVLIKERMTQMRVGVYSVTGSGGGAQGWINYADGHKDCVIESDAETSISKGIVQLALEVGRDGPVLIVASGKKTSENLARTMAAWIERDPMDKRFDDDSSPEAINRLDSRLEREMYPDVEMRKLLRYRIAYHHAGLPPRVRVSVEDAIRQKKIDYVFSTTTLAEGVNFPFSTVIVQSLVIRNPPTKGECARWHSISPRSFWNIAG